MTDAIDYDTLPARIRAAYQGGGISRVPLGRVEMQLSAEEVEWLAALVESYGNLFRLMRGGTLLMASDKE